jgi:hypothetical protein
MDVLGSLALIRIRIPVSGSVGNLLAVIGAIVILIVLLGVLMNARPSTQRVVGGILAGLGLTLLAQAHGLFVVLRVPAQLGFLICGGSLLVGSLSLARSGLRSVGGAIALIGAVGIGLRPMLRGYFPPIVVITAALLLLTALYIFLRRPRAVTVVVRR